MCVICYKPSGTQFPSKTKIRTMFKNNPNGAGFMYSDGQRVYIRKGFMTLSEFNTALNEVREHTEYPFVLHFRITTNGGTTRGLTHPFPLSDDLKRLTATECETACGIAHNGIIPMTAYAKKISDTAEFIRKYMTKLIHSESDIDSDLLDIIEACIDSKMCILTASAEVHLIGKFETDGNGVYYSNDSYKKPRKKSEAKYYTSDSITSYYNAYMPYCDGYCRYCKYEYDCFDFWSSGNPYEPLEYNDYDITRGGDAY